MPSIPRPETVVFAVLVAFLGWWLLDLPPLEKAVVTALAVAAFVAASALIEGWRRRYLEEHLDGEDGRGEREGDAGLGARDGEDER